MLTADPEQMRQVLVNFLGNAVKFTPEGGKVGIEIDDGENDEVRFCVWDTGRGIAPEHHEKIFERFYQEAAASVWASSKKSWNFIKGAFGCRASLARAAAFTSPCRGSARRKEEPMAPENLKKILLVDDEPDVLFVLKMALEKRGYHVDEASNGLEALDKVKVVLPDAIVMDIMMPKLDGLSTTERLKQSPDTQSIPIFIITGKGQLKELMEVRKDLNVACYLEKPFQVSALVDKLKEVLG
jgi:CheY-like chemotaxis protein